MSYLESLAKKDTNNNSVGSTTALMQVRIVIPTPEIIVATPIKENTKTQLTHGLQGLGDTWRNAMGHDDLTTKIRHLAQDVIKTGEWPRSQIRNGIVTDVTAVVAAEVERIKKQQPSDVDSDDKMKEIFDKVQQATNDKQSVTNIQDSFVSVSSNGIARNSVADSVGDQILAQLGLGGNANGGDGDDDDDSGDPNVSVTCNDAAARANGSRRNEFTCVNHRNIIITQLSGGKVNTTTISTL